MPHPQRLAQHQRRSAARVLLVGAGGLGTPIAMILADAGIGTLGVADDDAVAFSNLHRQILFSEADVGKAKTLALRDALLSRAPNLVVEVHSTRILPSNAVDLVRRYDLVVEGSDNFPTKFLTADACGIAKIPVIHGAAVRWHGTVLSVAAAGRPCYRCLFEDLPREHAPNCSEAGVMGPVVGVVAALQADAALGAIDESGSAGELVTFDGRTDEIRRRQISPRAGCELCGVSASIATVDPARYQEDSCAPV